MRINTEHRFVFVSTTKACTHTIYDILRTHFSEGLIERGFHSNRIPRQHQSYFRWTICRNPFARAVSIWWSACRLDHRNHYKFRTRCGAVDDFEKFIVWLASTSPQERSREPLMMNQSEWHKRVEPIHAIKVEELAEGLAKLPFWKPNIEIPQLNTTDQKILDQEKRDGGIIIRASMKTLLTDEAKEAVIRWADEDFDRFGYSREEIPNE